MALNAITCNPAIRVLETAGAESFVAATWTWTCFTLPEFRVVAFGAGSLQFNADAEPGPLRLSLVAGGTFLTGEAGIARWTSTLLHMNGLTQSRIGRDGRVHSDIRNGRVQ
jgi:hypothetical protein